jgi:hypothetical protein
MRLAIIVAFVSCVVFGTERSEARPGDRVAEVRAQKKKPARVKAAKAKPVARKAKVAAKPVKQEDDKPAEVKPVEKPVVSRGAPVAQAADDEVPRNEPAKKKR